MRGGERERELLQESQRPTWDYYCLACFWRHDIQWCMFTDRRPAEPQNNHVAVLSHCGRRQTASVLALSAQVCMRTVHSFWLCLAVGLITYSSTVLRSKKPIGKRPAFHIQGLFTFLISIQSAMQFSLLWKQVGGGADLGLQRVNVRMHTIISCLFDSRKGY